MGQSQDDAKDARTDARDDAPASDETTKVKRRPRFSSGAVDVAKARNLVARVAWLLCAFFAAVLALAALLGALEANFSNGLVKFILETADKVDLGAFDLRDPIKTFSGDPIDGGAGDVNVKTLLFNYGIAAVVWLGIGSVVNRLVRA